MTQCKAKTQSGNPCRARPLKGSQYCFIHDPGSGQARAKARKLGGHRNRTPHAGDPDSLPRAVRTLEDANKILVYVLDEVVPMENSIPRARVLLQLHEAFVKALEIGELEKRIAALEAMQQ